MNTPDIRDHELRLTAATLSALFFIEQMFLGQFSIVLAALMVGSTVWATFEWRRRMKLRSQHGIRRVTRLDQLARAARERPASSRVVVAFVCAALLVLIGQISSGWRGGLIGLGCGLLYLVLAVLSERYPPW
jgi:hypothetical protein